MTLQVLGDSYTSPNFFVEPKDSFWGLIANDLNTNIINYSSPGFSFDAILHILLNQEFDFKNDFFIIGIPPTVRETVYKEGSGYNLYKTIINDNNIVTEPIACLENVDNIKISERYTDEYQKLYPFSPEWHDVQVLEKVYFVYQYLKSHQARFIILNLSVPFIYQDMWPAGQHVIRKIKQLKECVIFDNTYIGVNKQDKIKPPDFNQYGWQGHPGPEGNLNYYNKVVKPLVDQLGWISV